MNFLPHENLTYKTHLSKKEIIRRLRYETEPKQLIRIGSIFGRHKEYEGTINENSFEISRIISYRNSFLPRIKGEIEESKAGKLGYLCNILKSCLEAGDLEKRLETLEARLAEARHERPAV